ncbi:MAG: ABC transporter substrate-binding protein [Rhodospirillales bacterium 70-18]|nr:TRAP transporter substrate-binding protein [Rhodospirillales bacterium]OJY63424.1 MAG: ABC transporter substrate-binding protein [Rhodospirillales bacterium 70-18]
MERRRLISSAAVGGVALGAVAAALPRPAIAQSMPEIKWRMPSSFPKSLGTLYGGAEMLAAKVAAMTDNKFQIRPFAAGEIVPPLAVLDAVQNGTVEIGQTASYYYVGKDPTFAFGSTVPFGFNTRQQQAWMLHGGGLTLMNEFLKDYNVTSIIGGNTGAQMGGWFRKEIKTPDDIKGLKFRIAGLAGAVIAKMGGVPQQIGGGDIYPALEKGTIDAAEWVGPYDDEKLGFYKVAKYYYYPGWWEGNAQLWIYVNLDKMKELPPAYQAVLEAACAEVNTWMQAKYDADNPAALRRLVANGTELRPFSREIMQAAYKASFEVYDELAAKNPKFKKVYDSWKAFREDEFLWFRVAENTYENFVYSQSAAEARAKK